MEQKKYQKRPSSPNEFQQYMKDQAEYHRSKLKQTKITNLIRKLESKENILETICSNGFENIDDLMLLSLINRVIKRYELLNDNNFIVHIF